MKESWEAIVRAIEQYVPNFNDNWEESIVQFEFLLATLSLDYEAIKNIFPDNAKELYLTFNEFISSLDTYGQYAHESIYDEYLPAINRSLQRNESPFDELVSILCRKLDLDDPVPSPLLMMTLSSIMGSLIGKWKWIDENFELVC